MSEEEKENLTEELEESETEPSMVSDEDTNETIDESSENTPSNEGNTNTITPEQVKGYKRNITGLGIALGILILLAALIVVALIVRGINRDTTCTNDGTCEVCEVCTEDTNSRSVPLTYMGTIENK